MLFTLYWLFFAKNLSVRRRSAEQAKRRRRKEKPCQSETMKRLRTSRLAFGCHDRERRLWLKAPCDGMPALRLGAAKGKSTGFFGRWTIAFGRRGPVKSLKVSVAFDVSPPKVGWYRGIISSLSLWRDVFLWDCGSAKHGTIRVINISQNDKTEQSDTFMNK